MFDEKCEVRSFTSGLRTAGLLTKVAFLVQANHLTAHAEAVRTGPHSKPALILRERSDAMHVGILPRDRRPKNQKTRCHNQPPVSVENNGENNELSKMRVFLPGIQSRRPITRKRGNADTSDMSPSVHALDMRACKVSHSPSLSRCLLHLLSVSLHLNDHHIIILTRSAASLSSLSLSRSPSRSLFPTPPASHDQT